MSQGALSMSLLSLSLFLHTVQAFNTYEAFRKVHGGATVRAGAAVSYEERRHLFHRRKAAVEAHNALNRSWTTTLNRFSDHTEEELNLLLGHKPYRYSSRGSSFVQVQDESADISDLAAEVDWRANLQSSNWVKNQGSCGSCWAVAATGALEIHGEKHTGRAVNLSHQQLVDCVQNPRHCGGSGGCDGATAELAYDYARRAGIAAAADYKSQAGGKCNANVAASLAVTQFHRLPVNQGSHLLRALATHGPVVVSADGGAWFSYAGGVFAGCHKDTVVNHAVLAVGYGVDKKKSGKKYWTIRNSWGSGWGERGFLRLERHSGDSDYCGTDNKPLDGVFCDGAPESVPVCGMCGVTSDSVYPTVSGVTPAETPGTRAFRPRRIGKHQVAEILNVMQDIQ